MAKDMKRLFLIFSHTLTDDQQKEAKESLTVQHIQTLPEHLQASWSSIKAVGSLDTTPLDAITVWLEQKGRKGDFVLIQGEFGASFYVVDFCFNNGFIPIYATSERMYEEKRNSDGTVERRHIFKHVNFREYRRWGSK